MPPKSIFRQPGTRHFQLVHRSQRDPLLNDLESSQHVLKPVVRENLKKGKSRADLETVLSPHEIESDKERNVGEASLYGIYYDDTKYDYMQHLKTVGVEEEGVESVFIEATPSSKAASSSKPKSDVPIQLRDLPPEALPSNIELPKSIVYESHQAVPTSISGLQPDMDPHLRQTLEALEDDAFVEDTLDEDFFGSLVAEGERSDNDSVHFDFREDGDEDHVNEDVDQIEGDEEQGWEASFAQFKKDQARKSSEHGSDCEETEGGDTIQELPHTSVLGAKKRRRKGASDASGYSMSSSSMFRTDTLLTLDERFDQMMIKGYDEEPEEEPSDPEDSDEAPDLITSREDFEQMMDNFLGEYEVLGRKMRRKLDGENGAEKLDTLRQTMGTDERVKAAFVEDGEDDGDILMPMDIDAKKDRWDCETILSTYSNLENHPRLIRAREPRSTPKITLDRKTGLPIVASQVNQRPPPPEDSDTSNTDDESAIQGVISRPKGESKEDRKARKQAVKEEQRARRADKKNTKEEFTAEMKRQKKAILNKELPKMRKL